MSWRRPLTRGALLLMESLWVYAIVAFLVALVAKDGDRPTLIGTLIVVTVSFSISRFLQASSLPLGLLRFYGVFMSLLIFYAIARVDFFGDWRFWDFSFADDVFFNTEATLRDKAQAVIGIPVLWFFWLRGVTRGQEYMGFEAVLTSFAAGIVVIAVVEVFAGAVDMPAVITYLPVPYIAIGLLTVGLTHAARAEDEFGRSYAPTWLIAVGGAVLVLGAFALIFIVLDYSAAFDLLSEGAKGVGWVVAKIFFYVTFPVLWLTEQFFLGLKWLIDNFYGGTRQEPQQQEEPEPREEEQEESKGLPAWAELLVRIIIGGSLAGFIIIGLAMTFNRFRKRHLPGEIKESTYQEGRLAADLGDLLGSFFGRLRPNFRSRADIDAARRLYFDLLAAGEARDIHRRPPETPLELAPRLDRTFAAETPGRITRLFDDVRYGGLPPPAGDVQRLREELEGLNQTRP
jgi:hypothetical protein